MSGERTVNFCGVPAVPAQFRIFGGGIPQQIATCNELGQAAFQIPTIHGNPANPTKTGVNTFYEQIGKPDIPVPGYKWYGVTNWLQDGNVDGWIVNPATLGYQPPFIQQWQQLSYVERAAPPIPTRAQLCQAQQTFQGLSVTSIQYGTLPLFDPVVLWFSGATAAADRQSFYATHKAADDQMVTVSLSGQYREAGQAYQNIPGADFSQRLPELTVLLQEIINNGFYVDLRLAGDGEGTGPGYNDPVGWTYGWQWLMNNFERIVSGLSSVAPWVRWAPAYDGWFYGWTPQQVQQFGTLFRSVLPTGVLCGEFGVNGCHAGGAGHDYAPGGVFYNYDLLQLEFQVQDSGGHNELFWQNSARMLGPAYVRPVDQPSGDDPHPPFYLAGGTDRGPYYASAFEDWLYLQVRNRCTLQQITDYRTYKRGVGYSIVG